jgi:methylase of polypeptide subunit release factors
MIRQIIHKIDVKRSKVLKPVPDRIKQYEDHLTVGKRVLDMGTGSGVLSELSFRLGARKVVAADINPDAVKQAKKRVPKAMVVQSNLFENIVGVFDTIIFAAPWSDGEIKRPYDYALYDTGVVDKFLQEAKGYLSKGGYLWVQYSDAFPEKFEQFKASIEQHGYKIFDSWSQKYWGKLVKKEAEVTLFKIGVKVKEG